MKKKSVIKHSAAVHITNNINLLQRRAWNILLANAYDSLSENETYQISIRELTDALGLKKSNNDYHIKEMLKELATSGIEWNLLGKDGKNKWAISALLAQAVIEEGVCTYSYSPFLREKLYNPAMYARISLSMQNRFDSKHSLALYELCIDYFIAKRKYGETPFISVEKFRKLMGLKDNEYNEFKILNKWIIKEPLKEINQKSDILVEVEYRKEKRRVTDLKFHIKIHPENQNPLLISELEQNPLTDHEEEKSEPAVNKKSLPEPVVSNPLYRKLTEDFLLSRSQAEEALRDHNESYILEKLAYVEEQYKNGTVKKLGSYTIKAIREDFRCKTGRIEKEKKEDESRKKIATARREIEEDFDRGYKEYRTNVIETYRNTLSQDELNRIEAAIWEQTKEAHKGKQFGLKGFFNIALNDYMAEQGKALSYGDWKKEKMKKYPELFPVI